MRKTRQPKKKDSVKTETLQVVLAQIFIKRTHALSLRSSTTTPSPIRAIVESADGPDRARSCAPAIFSGRFFPVVEVEWFDAAAAYMSQINSAGGVVEQHENSLSRLICAAGASSLWTLETAVSNLGDRGLEQGERADELLRCACSSLQFLTLAMKSEERLALSLGDLLDAGRDGVDNELCKVLTSCARHVGRSVVAADDGEDDLSAFREKWSAAYQLLYFLDTLERECGLPPVLLGVLLQLGHELSCIAWRHARPVFRQSVQLASFVRTVLDLPLTTLQNAFHVGTAAGNSDFVSVLRRPCPALFIDGRTSSWADDSPRNFFDWLLACAWYDHVGTDPVVSGGLLYDLRDRQAWLFIVLRAVQRSQALREEIRHAWLHTVLEALRDDPQLADTGTQHLATVILELLTDATGAVGRREGTGLIQVSAGKVY